MKRTSIPRILAAGLCLTALVLPAKAAEVESGAVYCFADADFDQSLTGICLTQTPQTGVLKLGSRIIRAGDILTAEQLSALTLQTQQNELDTQADITYLPIYENRVAPCATMSIAVRGRQDQSPVAEDSAMETYKNLPGEAMLKVKDPEGQALVYTVTRQPKRGDVAIREDGSFIYTPKKNKVGVDSFTYTATDPAGNVSQEATVTITILKPTDAQQYTDTTGKACRFAAEWMKNTGIFVAERVGGNSCFQPDKPVTRGEFLTMLVGALDIPVEDAQVSGFTDDAPDWLKPYLAAAMRSGLTLGLPQADTFRADEPITEAEAAVMLQNALKLDLSDDVQTAAVEEDIPDWAVASVEALRCNGIALSPGDDLTRGQAAQILYQASSISPSAPGTRLRNVVQ